MKVTLQDVEKLMRIARAVAFQKESIGDVTPQFAADTVKSICGYNPSNLN